MIQKLSKEKILLIIFSLMLTIIPFFWLKPGEVDLGGDSSRLYFYDPINYLKSFSVYTIAPNGFNTENTADYLIPFILLLGALKKLFLSSYLLITLFNSFTLVVAFLSVYGTVVAFLNNRDSWFRDDLKSTFAGILSGFLYIFSPMLVSPGWWSKALVVHNQFFLNPLIFFFLLKYILTKKFRYILIAGIVSFLFAPNFFLSPYFFSFYPFILLLLILYTVFIKKQGFRIQEIIAAGTLFFALHVFHLVPFLTSLFSVNGYLHDTAFSEGVSNRGGLDYFLSVAHTTKLTNNILVLPQGDLSAIPFHFLWLLIPIILVLGPIAKSKLTEKTKETTYTYALLFLFFLLTGFFTTGVITNISLELYKTLFIIPGFSMFRNYVGQFSHTFVFFYCIIFGFSLFYIFSFLKTQSQKIMLFCGVSIIFLISNIPFIKGDSINTISIINPGVQQEQKITIPMRMDPRYEDFLHTIRANTTDGKYFILPLDDAGIQILKGSDTGVYMGPPFIAYTAQKSEFAGAKGLIPFDNVFLKAVLNKDYDAINNLFSILNIRYVFYNSDHAIYDDAFPGFPYSYVRRFMPPIQTLYADFIGLLAMYKKQDFGQNYHLYELDPRYYLPHIYIAKNIVNAANDSAESIIKIISLYQSDKRVAIVNKIHNFENIGEAKKKDMLYDAFDKNPDTQVATNTIDPDLASRLAPLLVLRDKVAEVGLPMEEKISFDQAIYSSQRKLYGTSIKDKKSLEDALGFYKESMIAVIAKLNMQGESFYSPLMQKIKLAQVFMQDQNNFEKNIEHINLPQSEKTQFKDLTQATFSSLAQSLHTSMSNFLVTNYNMSLDQNNIYKAFVEKNVLDTEQSTKLSLIIDNTNIPSDKNQVSNSWVLFDTFKPNLQNSFVSLSQSESQYPIDKELLSALNDSQAQKYWVKLKISSIALDYIREIINYFSYWQPATTYFITFDYQSQNDPTSGQKWIHYKTIVESNINGDWALVLVLKDPNMVPLNISLLNDPRGIQIKNLSIISITKPTVLLQSQQNKAQKSMPKITFTKVNPTKYKVNVSGARDAYMLVFLDAYNPNWHVFLDKSQQKDNQQKVTQSYFDGDVNEGNHKDTFFDAATFETWGQKSIAEEKHYKVNGYANGWYIEPSDIEGTGDYTFTLEMTSQRSIYILLSISFMAFAIIILWLIGTLFKKYAPH